MRPADVWFSIDGTCTDLTARRLGQMARKAGAAPEHLGDALEWARHGRLVPAG